MSPEPDRSTTAPIRRLRVVPNPSATRSAPDRDAAAPAPIRPGGRHRKPDPDDELDAGPGAVPDATTDAVRVQRVARLTAPPGA